jgi:GNAT superfamily N-acetyltransferase
VAPKQVIDLTKIVIRPYSGETVTNRFSCGRRPIDGFIKNKAKKAERRFEQKTFCAHLGNSPTCVGFYSLQLGTDSVSDLPGSKSTYLKNYVAFPAVHLSFLGVHEDYRRQGLGQFLLMDALTKVAAISDYAGFYALTLQSLDAESTAFYESLGFASYSEKAPPKMLYPLEDIITLVRGPQKE